MTRDRGALGAYLSLILVMLFWAGNSIIGRAVRADIPPFTLAFLRWSLAFVLLLPVALRPLIVDRAALRAGWKTVLILGLLGVAGFNGFLYLGLHHTNASNALLLQAAVPAGVLIADRALFGQAATRARMFGVLLSTAGVVFVVAGGEIATLTGLRLGAGEMLVLAAVICWSLYTSLLRRKPAVHPLSLLAATFLIGALSMAPLAIAEWRAGNWPHAQPDVVAGIVYVAIFPSIFSYLLFNRAVERIGAGPAGQMISLMPLFGALIAAAVLDEPLHGYHLVGMGLIFGGIAFSFWMGRSRGDASLDPRV